MDLLRILKAASETGETQFPVVTHSPILMSFPGAVVFSFDENPVREIDYEDTGYYRL